MQQDPAPQQDPSTVAPETPVSEAAPPQAGGDEAYQPERGVLAEWLVTIVLLLFGTTMLVQAFVIPTGSMEDTLLIGDYLLVDKLAYAPQGGFSKYLLPYEPIKRGDIIVFRYPLKIENTYVKRAIGLPGDRIKIVDRVLYVNGKAMNEPYVVHKWHIDYEKDYFPNDNAFRMLENAQEEREKTIDKATQELVVPNDCYFALGDNRDSSEDSRYWGFVPRQNIIGKPLVVYWSNPRSFWEDPIHFMGGTNWKRSFMLVRGYPLN